LHNKIVLRASVSNTLVEHFSHIVEQYLKRYLDYVCCYFILPKT
jgi:hypothetical protein